jgi:hypothetical protein
MVAVLEARTYSPPQRRGLAGSLCGYFSQFSVPSSDFEAAQRFWEPLGFVATGETDAPYAHLPLTSDHLDLAFHAPRFLDRTVLVFAESDMAARIATLRERGIEISNELPRGLARGSNALLESPEGSALLLLTA